MIINLDFFPKDFLWVQQNDRSERLCNLSITNHSKTKHIYLKTGENEAWMVGKENNLKSVDFFPRRQWFSQDNTQSD